METNEIASALIKSSNEDDTKNLENVQKILDCYRKSDNPKVKELIYKEDNRFAEAVNKIIKDEQKKEVLLWQFCFVFFRIFLRKGIMDILFLPILEKPLLA